MMIINIIIVIITVIAIAIVIVIFIVINIIIVIIKRTELRLFLEIGREKVISHQVSPQAMIIYEDENHHDEDIDDEHSIDAGCECLQLK